MLTTFLKEVSIELQFLAVYVLFLSSAAFCNEKDAAEQGLSNESKVGGRKILLLLAVIFALYALYNNVFNNKTQTFGTATYLGIIVYILCCISACIIGASNLTTNLFHHDTAISSIFIVMFVICNLHWIAVMPKEEPYIIPKRYAEIGGPRYVDRNLELDGQHYVDREVLETIELVAINDAYELSGRGFFGSFIIDTDGYYRCYYRDHDNSIQQAEFSAMRDDVKPFDDCVDEGDLPRIERVRTRAWHYRYCWGKLMKIEDDTSPEWVEIHVPKGSIVSDFVLDLN